MSKECDYCGFRDPMPFTCKFCGNPYCYNHRLPESHNCSGLALFKERIHDSGGLYNYKPDQMVKKHKKPVFKPLGNAISTIRSSYSLTILIIAIISFFLSMVIPGYFFYLALYPLDIVSRPWTLVTSIFLHAGTMHLLFNMMILFFFGPELERRIGGKRFLAVFFLSGIIAAIGYSLWSIFIVGSSVPAIGASGAILGIFACLAVIAPHIQVSLFFGPPVRITYVLILLVLIDLIFGLLFGLTDPIARSAHLSGVVAGVVMGKQIKKMGQYIDY
ncbi:putative membrane protein [Candidatus Methanoperedens nitroreducens]|uniref:Putative membrane protein n=1 Tax=Candidatus Methanoperedens nitratireducens TaxID=1392998 RepID=A0A062UX48_9EURY|nr:rhomboid family intramembrane serine protease [Candidatus Methanoperedens nitroreducens]KCZ71566.1 putative membrane protein [Candidatus Methanoperedens nitroreducens]MDJ1421194.1 rhomboid family intramembrane serine protease [Candidatus Methanoperedens sp.]